MATAIRPSRRTAGAAALPADPATAVEVAVFVWAATAVNCHHPLRKRIRPVRTPSQSAIAGSIRSAWLPSMLVRGTGHPSLMHWTPTDAWTQSSDVWRVRIGHPPQELDTH